MAKKWPTKDPNARLDYNVDWNDWLVPGDTVDTSTWILPTVPDALLTSDEQDKTTTTTTIWLLGGTVGQTYELLNRIVTVQDRHMDQTVAVKIVNK